jgi:DNA-binding transcriptional ArsR family regulator
MDAKDPLEPERCSAMLSALAAPERLRIVRLLADGEQNVTQITEALGIPPLNVNHHLKVLCHANILRFRKQGRFVIYSLCEGVLDSKEQLNLGCCRIVMPMETA